MSNSHVKSLYNHSWFTIIEIQQPQKQLVAFICTVLKSLAGQACTRSLGSSKNSTVDHKRSYERSTVFINKDSKSSKREFQSTPALYI